MEIDQLLNLVFKLSQLLVFALLDMYLYIFCTIKQKRKKIT